MGIRKKWKDFAPGLMFALLCIVDWYTSNIPVWLCHYHAAHCIDTVLCAVIYRCFHC